MRMSFPWLKNLSMGLHLRAQECCTGQRAWRALVHPARKSSLEGVARVGFVHVAPAAARLPGCLRDDAIKVILHLCHVLTV